MKEKLFVLSEHKNTLLRGIKEYLLGGTDLKCYNYSIEQWNRVILTPLKTKDFGSFNDACHINSRFGGYFETY